jgi:hypothetical protein
VRCVGGEIDLASRKKKGNARQNKKETRDDVASKRLVERLRISLALTTAKRSLAERRTALDAVRWSEVNSIRAQIDAPPVAIAASITMSINRVDARGRVMYNAVLQSPTKTLQRTSGR